MNLTPYTDHLTGSEHADRAGLIKWDVSVDSTIARAHQHATNVTPVKKGFVELHESVGRAA